MLLPITGKRLGMQVGTQEAKRAGATRHAFKVASGRKAFAASLSTMTSGTKYENKNLSASEKTARCTQVTRVAKTYGFLKR
jgi:hypothetical protein